MSARPRPVTATINHQPSDTSLSSSLRPRRRSLSSGSSTASLCSILDHDSYESPSPSEDEQEHEEEMGRKEQTDGSLSRSSHTSPSARLEDRESVDYTEPVTTYTSTPSTPTNRISVQDALSPWEKWMVQKAKELRIQRLKEMEELRRQKAEEAQKKEEQCNKVKKAERVSKEWIQRKTLELKLKEDNEMRKKLTEKELEEGKKQEILEKSVEKFNEWKAKKRLEEREKRKAENEKKKKEEEEKTERQKKCEEAFNDWLNKTKERRKTAPQSYGYSSGKITGYYDRNSYPSPSFYNPLPWQPIHVPQSEGTRRKRPKSRNKKQWNPNKYL